MKRKLTVRLASPRGFCAGVERAIRSVEEALSIHGPPVYVRHQIVHNSHVIARLEAMGAVFVQDVADAPADRPLIISAHGAPTAVTAAAAARSIELIDATCPLVKKVHAQARRQWLKGRHVLLIGHAGHPEVTGTMGQAPAGAMTLIQSVEDAADFAPPDAPLAYVTQTTLSVDDTAEIIAALKRRFPAIEGPRSADICYATSNRQAAVKAVAPGADLTIVVGSPTSSNSCRLVEVARKAGCPRAALIEDHQAISDASLDGVNVLALTGGASAPELLIESVLQALARKFDLVIETIETAREDIVFKPPVQLLAS